MNQAKKVILYERLSRDDDNSYTESNSITNQKIILEEYASKNGMTNFIHITDDGISGLRFDDRPGYVQMMEEVENGNVSTVCVKDITRLGRDYLRVGMCMDENVKHKLKKHEIFFQNALKDFSTKKKQAIGI